MKNGERKAEPGPIGARRTYMDNRRNIMMELKGVFPSNGDPPDSR